MSKEELDEHIRALIGSELVNNWWDSPNKHWNGFSPRVIYERNEAGRIEVETYILKFCYGDYS